jgi:DNA topoisomerase VI subunit A
MFAIGDANAHGIQIVSVLNTGGMNLYYEKNALAAHRVIWLGLYPSEILK